MSDKSTRDTVNDQDVEFEDNEFDWESAFEEAGGFDPADIDAVLVAVAGYFTSSALEPEAPGLPGLRDFQRAQGDVARQWLAARTGWEKGWNHVASCLAPRASGSITPS